MEREDREEEGGGRGEGEGVGGEEEGVGMHLQIGKLSGKLWTQIKIVRLTHFTTHQQVVLSYIIPLMPHHIPTTLTFWVMTSWR